MRLHLVVWCIALLVYFGSLAQVESGWTIQSNPTIQGADGKLKSNIVTDFVSDETAYHYKTTLSARTSGPSPVVITNELDVSAYIEYNIQMSAWHPEGNVGYYFHIQPANSLDPTVSVLNTTDIQSTAQFSPFRRLLLSVEKDGIYYVSRNAKGQHTGRRRLLANTQGSTFAQSFSDDCSKAAQFCYATARKAQLYEKQDNRVNANIQAQNRIKGAIGKEVEAANQFKKFSELYSANVEDALEGAQLAFEAESASAQALQKGTEAARAVQDSIVATQDAEARVLGRYTAEVASNALQLQLAASNASIAAIQSVTRQDIIKKIVNAQQQQLTIQANHVSFVTQKSQVQNTITENNIEQFKEIISQRKIRGQMNKIIQNAIATLRSQGIVPLLDSFGVPPKVFTPEERFDIITQGSFWKILPSIWVDETNTTTTSTPFYRGLNVNSFKTYDSWVIERLFFTVQCDNNKFADGPYSAGSYMTASKWFGPSRECKLNPDLCKCRAHVSFSQTRDPVVADWVMNRNITVDGASLQAIPIQFAPLVADSLQNKGPNGNYRTTWSQSTPVISGNAYKTGARTLYYPPYKQYWLYDINDLANVLESTCTSPVLATEQIPRPSTVGFQSALLTEVDHITFNASTEALSRLSRIISNNQVFGNSSRPGTYAIYGSMIGQFDDMTILDEPVYANITMRPYCQGNVSTALEFALFKHSPVLMFFRSLSLGFDAWASTRIRAVEYQLEGELPYPLEIYTEYFSSTGGPKSLSDSTVAAFVGTSQAAVPEYRLYNRKIVTEATLRDTATNAVKDISFDMAATIVNAQRFPDSLPMIGYVNCIVGPCYTVTNNLTVSSVPKVYDSFGEDNNSTLYGKVVRASGLFTPHFYSVPDSHIPYAKTSVGKKNTIAYTSKPDPVFDSRALTKMNDLYDGLHRRMWATTLTEWRQANNRNDLRPSFVTMSVSYYIQQLLAETKNVVPNSADGSQPGQYKLIGCTSNRNTIEATLCDLWDISFMDVNLTRGTVRFYPLAGQLRVDNAVVSFDTKVSPIIPVATNECPDSIEFRTALLEPIHILVTNERVSATNKPFEIRGKGCDSSGSDNQTIYVTSLDAFHTVQFTLSGCSSQVVEVWANSTNHANPPVMCKSNSETQRRSASPFDIVTTPVAISEFVYAVQDPVLTLAQANLDLMKVPLEQMANDVENVIRTIYGERSDAIDAELEAGLDAAIHFLDAYETHLNSIVTESVEGAKSMNASITRDKEIMEESNIGYDVAEFMIQSLQSFTSSSLTDLSNIKAKQAQIHSGIDSALASIPQLEPYAYMFINVSAGYDFSNGNLTAFLKLISDEHIVDLNLPLPLKTGNTPCDVTIDPTTWFCNFTGPWAGVRSLFLFLISWAIFLFVVIVFPMIMKLKCSGNQKWLVTCCTVIPLCNVYCCMGLQRALCKCKAPPKKTY